MLAEVLDDGRPGPGHLPRRRGADRLPGRARCRERLPTATSWTIASTRSPTRKLRPGDSLLIDPEAGYAYERIPKSEVEELVLEEVPDVDYDDIGGLGPADRADPRRGGAAVPARRPVPRAPAAPAEGHPALRPARLRQDADRQGGRQLAGQEDRRGAGRGEATPATSSTSRARSCSTSTSARPSGTSGWSSSGPGRRPARARRSSCSSTRWTRSSAPAAPASPPTWRTRSSRSCSARSTASRAWRTSSSSAPPTART